MTTHAERLLRSPVARFLLVGGTNTLVTAGIVVLLSLILPGWLAFTIAFALGIVFSVFATGRWVFRSPVSLQRGLAYAAAYVVIYGCGLLVVQLLSLAGAPPWANAASVIVTAPLSFLAGRLIFRTRPTDKESS